MEDYDDNRKLQPIHGRRTYIPGADEQFDEMYREREDGEEEEVDLGAEEGDDDG